MIAVPGPGLERHPRPGILLGGNPEQTVHAKGRLQRWEERLARAMTRGRMPSFRQFASRIESIRKAAETFRALSGPELASAASRVRVRLRSEARLEGALEGAYESAFALVCVLCERRLGLLPHDEQLYGGWLILQGNVAEMATGEGKTLCCALPAATAALAGSPVHVVSVNDYLVRRDADFLAPVYEGLGLTVGAIAEGSSPEQRRRAYACDVTYVSNKQLVFDYLRDRQTIRSRPNALRERLEPLVSLRPETSMQRGLCFAIVDEADSVLIDDARTPFVLSRPVAEAGSATEYTVALGIARRLRHDEHFEVHGGGVQLTEDGLLRLEELTSALPNRWRNARFRRELVQQALMALHFFVRDKHYVVKDGAVVLIDETTGRAVPDRSLSNGLHQMVQIKERSPVTQPTATMARISYQSFFGRYLTIGGMTGTGWEVRRELTSVYGMKVLRVPTHAPRRVADLGMRLFASMQEKYECLLDVVSRVHGEGRPILIGTRSVAESEQLQRLLERRGFGAQVLNANQDARESEIVSSAGQPQSIVVATNMAGRGTDIPLGEGVAERGGLHVISIHLNDSPRIDRQLFGRCGRQGDPGSCQSILSLEDDVFSDTFPPAVLAGLRFVAGRRGSWWRYAAPLVAACAQILRSNRARRARAAVRRADERLDSLFSFAANRSPAATGSRPTEVSDS